MIDGSLTIEVYELDGKCADDSNLHILLYPLDGECAASEMLLLKYGTQPSLAVSIDELISAVAALRLIAKART